MDTTRANHVEAALRDVIVDQPEVAFLAARCRGVLSNVLGGDFAEHRAEVELVAGAVEHEVPQALTRSEPLEVVAERFAGGADLPIEDARWAVRAWAFALAALDDEVPLPAAHPSRSWPNVQHVDTLELYAMRMALVRRVLLALAVVAGMVALWAVFVRDSGTDGSSVVQTQDAVELMFPRETSEEGLRVERRWRLRGDEGTAFEGRVVFRNPTDQPITDEYDEVITKELAATSTDVLDLRTSGGRMRTEWVREDPVLRVHVTLAPRETATLTYGMLTPARGLDEERLHEWRRAWRAELLEWRSASTSTTAAPTTTPPPTTFVPPTTTATTAPPRTNPPRTDPTPTAAPTTAAPPPPPPPPPPPTTSARVTVPNVVNMTEAQARSTLGARGLGVSASYQCGGVVQPGTVIAQNPGGGATVAPGSTVSIVVERC